MNTAQRNRFRINTMTMLDTAPQALPAARAERIRAGHNPSTLDLAILCDATGKTVPWALGIGPRRERLNYWYGKAYYRTRKVRYRLIDLRRNLKGACRNLALWTITAGFVATRRILTDTTWTHIQPILPTRVPRQGGRWHDHRDVVEAIIWDIRAGRAPRRNPR